MTDRLLVGWKEIARFLGCSDETARRLEAEHKLPIYRPSPRRVYAYESELRKWLKRRVTFADTIHAEDARGIRTPVRLRRVNAPELGQPAS